MFDDYEEYEDFDSEDFDEDYDEMRVVDDFLRQ